MKNTIKNTIQNRLKLFQRNGASIQLNYESNILNYQDIAIAEDIFNRIFFTLCSSILKDQDKLQINVKNNSQFFILSLDYNESNLSSLNGIFSSPKRLISPLLHNFSHSGISLITTIDEFGRNKLAVKIPIFTNEETCGPLTQRAA